MSFFSERNARLIKNGKYKIAEHKNNMDKFYKSSTLERCHPRFNGYRENVIYYGESGVPKLKKIIFYCIKCSMIADTLYKIKPTKKIKT